MTPCQVGYCSLLFLPATPSSPAQTAEGQFELKQRPSRALDSPHVLLLELQRRRSQYTVNSLAAGIFSYETEFRKKAEKHS